MATKIVDVVNGINTSVMLSKASGSIKPIATIGFQAKGSWTGDLKLLRSINGVDYSPVKLADGSIAIFDPTNPFIDLLPTKSFIKVDMTGVTSTDLVVEVSI